MGDLLSEHLPILVTHIDGGPDNKLINYSEKPKFSSCIGYKIVQQVEYGKML